MAGWNKLSANLVLDGRLDAVELVQVALLDGAEKRRCNVHVHVQDPLALVQHGQGRHGRTQVGRVRCAILPIAPVRQAQWARSGYALFLCFPRVCAPEEVV